MSGIHKSLSVILTVYQQREFLPLILNALELQRFEGKWQLMVCDDGSTDEVPAILAASPLAKRIEVSYYWQQDIGFRAARARNAGIRCTSGDVLVFLDGDSIPDRRFLERHAAAHDGTRRVVCGSRGYLFLDKYPLASIAATMSSAGPEALAKIAHMHTRPFQLARIQGKSPWLALCGCNFSVWRSPDVIFDDSYVGWGIEDYELALRLWSENSYHLQCVPENIVYHLEKTPSAVFHPLRSQSAQAIELYIANVIRISERYPAADMESLWKTLGNYARDQHGQWGLLQAGTQSMAGNEMYRVAKAWHQERSAELQLANSSAIN
jgi:glycosyltransferase involved in cell wall biosynthesis